MFVSMSYHTVVQHSIRQRSVAGVLAVQILADHLNVSLLTHLLGRFHPKADVASVKKKVNNTTGLISYKLTTRRLFFLYL